MNVVHLMGSPFVGGPERQALGLARHLPASVRTTFLSFAEGGRARALLDAAARQGCEGVELRENAPHFFRAAGEIADYLRRVKADVLLCSGYKPDVIGWLAGRRAGVPAVAIAHGWTAATLKVRLNEALDRWVLRRMACTVCVSEAMAVKVRRAGVPPDRVAVIRNAIDAAAFDQPDPAGRRALHGLFDIPRSRVVGAAGRLSPEKGFDVLVEAAARVTAAEPGVGFALFGDGPLRGALARLVAARSLGHRFVLGGFRADLHRLLPHFDVAVLPSYTEGLPVVVLEAMAAGVPVVATAVGGTPEAVEDGVQGYLVPPGDPAALADRILRVLRSEPGRLTLGQRGRRRALEEFTFEEMAARYLQLFERLTGSRESKVFLRVEGDGQAPAGLIPSG
jgi:glycosyltransferase involved in cell wall biosynthesis